MRVPGGACVSSVDIFGHLAFGGVGRFERVLHARGDLRLRLVRDALELLRARETVVDEARAELCDRVAVRLPLGLLVLRAVVRAIDVADVVAVVAVRVGDDERRAVQVVAVSACRREGLLVLLAGAATRRLSAP